MRAPMACVLLIIPAAALAGDAAELDFIGFSEDGSYFAYSESGVQDGSGFPYCSIRAVETATADVVWATDIVFDEYRDSSGDVGRAAMREAKASIFALGIRPGSAGFHAVHHPLSDLGASPDTVIFSTFNAPEPWGGAYRVVLEAEPHEDPAMLADWGFEPATASLWLEDGTGAERRALAVEAVPAGSERYTWGYRLQDVYLMDGDVLVVIVETFGLGFEGADVRFISACGRLSQLEK